MKPAIVFIFIILSKLSSSQSIENFADSLRVKYQIPELNFAVVSGGKIITLHALGVKKINADLKAQPNDRFRIGSNTKTVTGFIAALLVKQDKIKWDTKFFDLFPELKAKSNNAYYGLNLMQLLSFRSNLISWTYTNELPSIDEHHSEIEQRFEFVTWFLSQKPRTPERKINFSNPGYVAAGLMLERCSGKSYKELVNDLGKQLDIDFDFGPPNLIDSLTQPWGHNEELAPEPPKESFKLNWLQAAGNINVSLPDYCKFIQLQLRGLNGRSELLDKNEFEFLHYGSPEFSIGWFWSLDEDKHVYSHHTGNPGTFLSEVYIFRDLDKAFLLFTNCQSEKSEAALVVLFSELKKRYLN